MGRPRTDAWNPAGNRLYYVIQPLPPRGGGVGWKMRQEKERGVRIYLGNLPYSSTEDDIEEAFRPYGEVASVTIIRDRDTGRPKGFGFVEMPVDGDAQSAIAALNGREMGGRVLTVNEARPREPRF